MFIVFYFSIGIRHTRCALVTGVQTCALPIYAHQDSPTDVIRPRRAALESVLSAWGDPVGARGRLLRIGALRTAVRDGPSDRQGSVDSTPFDWSSSQIGRASCRERVCQYV